MLHKTMKLPVLFLFICVIFNSFSKAQDGGYSDRMSVTGGEKIKFYISTPQSVFDLKIYKAGKQKQLITTVSNLKGGKQSTASESYLKGAGWNVTHEFLIPRDWQPGVYLAQFPTKDSTDDIIFTVKPSVPASTADILVILSTNTWHAYNDFGGKSLYDYQSTDNKMSPKISMLRPITGDGKIKFYDNELKLIKWLDSEQIKAEYVTEWDVHSNNLLLNSYKTVIVVGHSEYWSFEQRRQFENYISNGGKVVVLSGNTCWWQIRWEDNGNTIVCYKERELDPLNGKADSLVTTNWYILGPQHLKESTFLGASFYNGGYVNNFSRLPAKDGYGDYTVYNAHHWIYEGTGLTDGDEFGYEASIVGNEVDGAKFTWKNGIPVVTGDDNAPLNYCILGLSKAESSNPEITNPFGTMGFYSSSNGGAVFNAATIHWSNGLESDKHVQQITRNVITRFRNGTIPPEIMEWQPARTVEKVINNTPVFLNIREMLTKDAAGTSLSVEVEESTANTSIKWIYNGKEVGTGDNFLFQPDEEADKHIIEALASANSGTAGIKWKFFNSELAVSSEPVLEFSPGEEYRYTIKTFNYYNDQISYTLAAGPSWLRLSQQGLLYGTPPQSDSSSYFVAVEVTNTHNQKDIQQFNISYKQQQPGDVVPGSFVLEQNYPNPFNPTTIIRYHVPKEAMVSIKLYDILGREAAVLLNEVKPEGDYELEFDGTGFTSSVYFYTLTAEGESLTRKLMIIR